MAARGRATVSAGVRRAAASSRTSRTTPPRKHRASSPEGERLPIQILPLAPERWRDFTLLFGAKGACAGCWCTWARLTHAQFRAATPEQRRAHTRRVVNAGDPPGLLAYEGDAPVGWVALAPRTDYPRLATSRVLAPVDDAEVWSVSCFFVAKTHRRRGLTVRMLEAACDFAAQRGARMLEGYPIDTKGARQAATFLWTGLPAAFAAAGFREVARRSPTRPIMRRAVRPGRKAGARG